MRSQSLPQQLVRWTARLPMVLRLLAVAAPLFRPGLPRAAPRLGLVAQLPASDADIASLIALSGSVQAQIAASACLERCIDLPRAARGEAAQAVDLHLRASLPMGGRGLIWRVQPLGEVEGRLRMRALIVKEVHLADLVARAGRAGIALSSINLADLVAPPLWEADPVPQHRLRNWAAGSFLAVALVALMAVLALESRVRELRDLSEQREVRVAALRERVAQRQAHALAAADKGKALSDQWLAYRAGSRPLTGLATISAALPEGVWLSEIAMNGSDWRLSGFSAGDVSLAVTALQALPGAQNVRLDGPIQFDSYSAQNRFDLVLGLAPEGQK